MSDSDYRSFPPGEDPEKQAHTKSNVDIDSLPATEERKKLWLMNEADFLRYEISGSWWPGVFENERIQWWIAWYMVKRMKRKLARYKRAVEWKRKVKGYVGFYGTGGGQ